uniref:Uncharacterized protein n=1 Tax=Panagrellus redivivus TaxID=6233 RepID=A0A7E4V6M0_PANRE
MSDYVTLEAHAEGHPVHLKAMGRLQFEKLHSDLPRIQISIHEPITRTTAAIITLRPRTGYIEHYVNSRFIIDNLIVTIAFKNGVAERENLLNFIEKTFSPIKTTKLCDDIKAARENRSWYEYCSENYEMYRKWDPLSDFEPSEGCPSSVMILSEIDDVP